MIHALKPTVRLGAVLFAAGLGLVAGAANAQPDLVVTKESFLNFVSCERNQPLAEGTLIIKNIGDSRANRRAGVFDRFSRSLLAVYVPTSIDMIDRVREFSILDARDAESIRVSIGKGVIKKGRIADPSFESFGSGGDDSLLRVSSLTADHVSEIQGALKISGYYGKKIDGDYGGGTTLAVEAFQRALVEPRTGVLTIGQAKKLARKAGATFSFLAPDAPTGPFTLTLYAVVDPFNLVEESNELNNLRKITIEVDCG